MKLLRTSAALIVLGMIATASVGQESSPPVPPPAQAPAKPAAAPPTAPATPPAAGGEAAAPAAPATGVLRDDEFIPTQEVQADEEVTFPVDI